MSGFGGKADMNVTRFLEKSRPLTAGSKLYEFWRSFFKSYDSVWNDIPRRFGAYKNVPANLDVRISICTTKRHTVNGSLKYAAEC